MLKVWLQCCALINVSCSSQFKSFAYLYNEDQFTVALAEHVKVEKTLPKHLKGARRKKAIPSFKVSFSASPYFYLHNVLPVLTKHSVVELVISEGGCLQVGFFFIANRLLCIVLMRVRFRNIHSCSVYFMVSIYSLTELSAEVSRILLLI